MKKLALIIAIVLGINFCTFAQWGGGLFQRGAETDEQSYGTSYFDYIYERDIVNPILPGLPDHDLDTNQDAPLGGGVLLLIGFGAAYAMKKKRK